MKEKGLWGEFIGELVGTFVLILFGDGVVANVGLAPRLASPGYDWNTIILGWGFAVVMGVYVAGGITGAHINPAVTLAAAVKRDFPWSKVPVYWAGQFIGAFLGAFGVYLVYLEGLKAAGMPNVWCTGWGSVFGQTFWGSAQGAAAIGHYSLMNATIAEIVGTAMLIWGVYAVIDNRNVAVGANLWPLLIGFVVMAIGLSLGGPSGYAINPARDLAPRIFGSLVGTKGLFDGLYWLVAPVIGPFIGAVLGAYTYDWFITPYLPE